MPDFEAGLKDKSLYDIEERTTIALDDEVEAASNELSTAARVKLVANLNALEEVWVPFEP